MLPGKIEYTHEITKSLVAQFAAGVPVCDLASQFGTTERSIIAKLSSMGLYKKKAYVGKTGEPPVKKEFYVEKLAELLEIDIDLAESLGKVNKGILKRIIDKIEQI